MNDLLTDSSTEPQSLGLNYTPIDQPSSEFNYTPADQSEEEILKKEPLDPQIIAYMAPQFVEEDYSSGISKLKDLYEKNNWTDKELAAQNISKVADSLNRKHQITPEFNLDSDATVLSHKLIDETLTKETKIDAIESWRTDAKRRLYNTDLVDGLITGSKKEELIDQYATELRRGVVAGNRGTIIDAIARGTEAALSPITGTTDAVFGTDLDKSLKKTAADYENPSKDNSIIATAASIVGTIGGVAASTANPLTAYGYLASIITSQAKQVYDTALKETKSHTAAQEALINSTPGIILGAVSDKIVGGTLGNFFKGEKGIGGIITNTLAGSVGAVGQTAISQEALAQATGNSKFAPTKEELELQAIVGGTIGLGIGALGSAKQGLYKSKQERQIVKAREEFQKAIQGTDSVEQGPSFMSNYIKPTSTEGLPTMEEPAITPPGAFEDRALAASTLAKDETTYTPEAFVLKNSSENGTTPTVLPISQGFTPSAFVQVATRRLDGKLGLQDLPAGFYGFYDPTSNQIVLNRSVFKDPTQAQNTLAHEFGHFYDAYRKAKELGINRPESGVLDPEDAGYLSFAMHGEDVLEKLAPIHDVIGATVIAPEVRAQAKQLSLDWRPPLLGGEGDSPYRNSATEIQADTFSALINNPALVQAEYPIVWDAFNIGLKSRPELEALWNQVIDLNQNPEKVLPYTINRMQEGRLREANIVKQNAETKILERKEAFKEALLDAKTAIKQKVINRFSPAAEVVDVQVGAKRAQAEATYQELYRGFVSRQEIAVEYDVKMNKLLEKSTALGVNDADWKTYEKFNRVLNETTDTIENIKQNSESYRKAGQLIDEEYRKILPLPEDKSPLKALAEPQLTNDLIDTLSQIHGGLFDKGIRARLIKTFSKKKDTPLEVFDLLQEGGFGVRGKLANPDVDYPTAERGIVLLKQKLGPEGYTNLQKISKEFHDIVATPMYKSLEESGIFNDKTMRRLKLNKNSYITYNVLDYFEKDPRISATIRQQVGTFRQVGDELASTIMKSKAIFGRSETQIAHNNAISLARIGGLEVKPVEPKIEFVYDKHGKSSPKTESIYDQQARLQSENPNKSYLVGTEKGEYTLYEIDSPTWAKMFDTGTAQNIPVLGAGLKYIDAYYKLFMERELKTVLSPVFAARQRFYDTQNEAVFARKTEIPGLPFHINPELRAIKKEAFAHANKFVEGEFTEPVRALMKGGALPFHHGGEYGGVDTTKAEHAIYERLGVPIPKEAEADIANRISKNLSNALDKTFFGRGIKAAVKPVKKAGDRLRKFAERDEAATKIAGYLIAKDIKGLSDAEAIRAAREYFGTPDTFGGGTEATSLNKLFLFGRAHVNGLRAVANQFKADPRGYGIQFAYYKLLPRMLVSSAIMSPLISSIFGDEEGKAYKAFLDKIPEFDKMSKFIVPLGFTDSKGEFKGFNVSSKEIGPEWKARYLRLPQSRELFTIDTLFNPQFKALEELINTGTINAKHYAQNWTASLGSAFLGNVSPAIMGAVRTSQLIGGFNPYDYYRNRGVLPKDVAESGSLLQKTYNYLGWSAFATAPGIFTSALQSSSTESLDPFDYAGKIPLAGPAFKGFIGSTNYGDYEIGLKNEQAKKELDSDIRLNLGPDSKALYNEYNKYQALTSRIGKGWESEVGPKLAAKIHAINNWHSRIYQHAFNDLRSHFEKADEEAVSKTSDSLEQISSAYRKSSLISEK